ncbi:hypothetical protein BaRGS_00015878 [Batillaria attramentaria]|uniref:Uncharacterized protein n=1 Tax=Batillaria attramentaria TaxID=370345 RepID=A0ABD0L0P5_9CAEN
MDDSNNKKTNYAHITLTSDAHTRLKTSKGKRNANHVKHLARHQPLRGTRNLCFQFTLFSQLGQVRYRDGRRESVPQERG